MRLASLLVPLVVLGVAVGCGEDMLEPGALTITVSTAPPEITNQATVEIVGQVTRVPAAEGVPIVVTLSKGGATMTDSASATGAFSFTVTLTLNAANDIELSATDGSGSAATPVTVSVLQDNQGPGVAQVQPANTADGVSAGVVQVTLNEKVYALTGAGITVSRQGLSVAGTVSLANDSLTLTFTPAVSFASNVIHLVTVGGYRDAAGNMGTGSASCFVTGGATSQFADPADDGNFVAGTPAASLVEPEFTGLRVGRDGSLLTWILQFAGPRSLNLSAPTNFFAWLDIDTDENDATGFLPVKDDLLGALLPPSGAGADYAIVVTSMASQADSSVVGQLSESGVIPGAQFTQLFVPDLCGPFVGFSVPLASIADEGSFRVVGFLRSQDHPDINQVTGLLADAAPDAGFYAVNVAGSPPVSIAVPRPSIPLRSPATASSGEWRVRRPRR